MLLLFLPVLRFCDFRAKQPDALEYATEDSAAPSRTSVRSVPKIMDTVAERTGPDFGLSQFQLFFFIYFYQFHFVYFLQLHKKIQESMSHVCCLTADRNGMTQTEEHSAKRLIPHDCQGH